MGVNGGKEEDAYGWMESSNDASRSWGIGHYPNEGKECCTIGKIMLEDCFKPKLPLGTNANK